MDLENIVNINYNDKILQIKNIIKQWLKRNLIVIGRISVIKTLVLPILNHLIISLPNPSDSVFRNNNEIFYTFVWNSPIHRVKKDVLVNEYLEGGIKMIDLYSFTMALKSLWIRRIFQRDSKWQSILMSDIDKNKLFNYGVQYIKQVCLHIKNSFWKDVFRAWEMIIDKERNMDYEYFLSSPIWFNNMIRIVNTPVFLSTFV